MTKQKVRKGFTVHLSESEVYEAGAVLDLTPEQVARHAHQIEAVKEAKNG